MKALALRLLTEYRSAVMVGFALPAGFVFDAAVRLRGRLRRLAHGRKSHDDKVQAVQAQVRRWASQPQAERRPMCTDRKTWMNLSTRFEPKHRWACIRMGDLREVLEIDEHTRTVRVEPFVTVGEITRELAPRGYMLAVHLEIADATIGGLALAAGMTTHSHRVGLLCETVRAWEVVLADGSLVRATATEHADLFRALPYSHGTLGLLVGLELDIVPVESHVRLRYEPVRGQAAYCARMLELATAEPAPHFIEATVFSRDEAVVMVGDFAEPGPHDTVNPIGRFYKPWFYTHVRRFLDTDGGEELVPLPDYLLRHNRSIFWVVESMIPFGNHAAFRWLLGWLMPPKIAFMKFTTTPAVRKMTFTLQVFQDIVLPMSAMARAIDETARLFDLWPILLYPCRVYDHGPRGGQLRRPAPEDLVPGKDHAMYFDLGVYGVPGPIKRGRPFKTVHAMRRMEAFTQSVRGFPFLYADTFMTRAEFERMFDMSLYRQVRARYGADAAFPELYDKIEPEVDVLAVLDEEADGDPLPGDAAAAE